MPRLVRERKVLAYSCIADSLVRMQSKPGRPSALLVLSEDMAIIRPWVDLRAGLLQRNLTTLMGLTEDLTMRMAPLSLFTSPSFESIGPGMTTQAKANAFVLAISKLPQEHKARIGQTVYSAKCDMLYIPLWQSRDFADLARIMLAQEVHFEWALPTVTLALSGPERAILKPAQGLSPLYVRDRSHIKDTINQERRKTDVIAVHPASASGGRDQLGAALLAGLYADIFKVNNASQSPGARRLGGGAAASRPNALAKPRDLPDGW